MLKKDPSLPGLVKAERCLQIVFPDKLSRPTVRWFWEQKIRRRIPYRKIGKLIFFDPVEVRKAIDEFCSTIVFDKVRQGQRARSLKVEIEGWFQTIVSKEVNDCQLKAGGL